MIKEFWAKLNERQRYYLIGGFVFVVIVLILEFAVFPFWEAKDKIRKSITTNQKKLNEIIQLDAEFARQEAIIVKIKTAMAARPADFSLFSYVEKKAVQASVKGNIKNMSSSRGVQTVNYEESLVDIKLDKVTIKQLMDFLYYAESPTELVQIKRITINKMKESPEYLTAQLQMASYQLLNQRPAGKN